MSDENVNKQKKKRATGKDGDKKDFLLVGIGASAGGIKALKEFFALMPPDSGMAFVVILHLSQQHESNLAQILQRETAIPVEQITETVRVEPNRVYVIPPAKHLEMVDGIIRLQEPERIRGKRVPIDRFFRSLAEAYGTRAISVILSGTGTDGTLGMKHIKGRDGFAMVQDPLDAEYDGMPRSAIETKIADVVLPVAEMPEKLLSVRDSTERFRLQNGKDGEVAKEIKNVELLRDVLTLLRVRTGHDFSNYKRPTILRRVARHLQIHETDDLEVYLKILREKPDEVLSLLKNLLINVTNFFRDKEAFAALEQKVIPALFEGKKSDDQVRVWSAGCASGEEAYSLAILLSEYAATLPDPPKIQVFASDVDDDAVSEAREGRFTETVVSDIAPERLKQFFIKEDDGYRIRKQIREMILFAPHNILRDPPFSRLDLVSCRNVLIYLNRDTQEKILQVFHFALRENGFLFLGSSESAESVPQNFSAVDKKHRIYQCQPLLGAASHPVPQMPVEGAWLPKITDYPAKTRDNLQSFGELHHRLIEHYAPPSILVNEEGDILHLSENAGRFLRFTGGQPSVNLLKVVHPDLLSDLRTALFAARQDDKTVEAKNIRVDFEGAQRLVNLTVRPLNLPEAAALVMLEVSAEGEPQAEESVQAIVAGDKAMETVLRRMEDELRQTKDRLRNSVEQYETTVEEHKASNEELQAINEELRSASEELETGKEELQSLNEELTTVNHELKDKIDETTRINSDLQNLMQSTNIATIFLDRELRIKRFTPPATQIFNVIPADIGRPLGHLTHRLSPDDFQDDAAEALRTLKTIEREVVSNDDRVFLARIAPYRTIEDKIDGAVLAFIDITKIKQAEEAVRASEEKYRTLFDSMDEGVSTIEMIFDKHERAADFRFLENNPAFARLTGIPGDVTGKLVSEVAPNLEPVWLETYGRIAKTGKPERFELYNGDLDVWFDADASRVGGASRRKVVIVYNNITERKRTEANLAFLAEVSQDLVGLTNVRETMDALGEKIGKYFNVSRCNFAEINKERDEAVITHDWRRENLQDISGKRVHRLKDFISEEFYRAARQGEMLVVRDTRSDARTTDAAYAEIDVRSFVTAPFVREGEWKFLMSVSDSAPRDWADDEIELLREITSRIWIRLERARAREALNASEERLQRMVNVPLVGVLTFNFDGDLLHANDAFLEMVGYDRAEFDARSFTWRDFTPPEYVGESERIMQQLRQIGRAGPYEKEYFRADGSRVWLMFVAADLGDGTIIEYAVDVSDRKRAEAAVREKENLRQIVRAQEDERKRIAQDLHDHLGQQLTALRLKLEFLRQTCDGDEKTQRQVDETQAIAQQIDADIDFLSWEMRPSALDDIGLAAALENYVREWTRNFGIAADFRADDFGRQRLAPETETNLYRIAQEAMNNIAKHARAKHVDITLERRDGFAVLIVEDDGIGFKIDEQETKSIGLIGMRERAALIRGTVEIETAPGAGTTVYVRVPVGEETEKEKKDK